MRTDATWREILAQRPPKPQRLVEEEVAPGRILFGPGRRQWLALLGTVFGLGGAGATLGAVAHRDASAAAAATCPYYPPSGLPPEINLLPGGRDDAPQEADGPPLYAIVTTGRRRDPAW